MNAVLQARPRTQAMEISSVGLEAEVLASWRVQAGAWLVLGRVRGAVPASGMALVQRMVGARGAFRCVSWPAAEGGQAFVAAVRLPERADPPGGAGLLLRSAGHEPIVLVMPQHAAADEAFALAVAQAAPTAGGDVTRFLLGVLQPAETGTEQKAQAPIGVMLRALTARAARPNGFVEIMAAIPGICVLLQGWGAPAIGTVQMLLAGAETLAIFPAQAGWFARADTAPPATGIIAVLPVRAMDALAGVDKIYVLDESGLHSRILVEKRLLDPIASMGHLRHMLPQLQGPAPMLAMLQEAIRPRFDGQDTLSSNPHPVRAAADMVAGVAGLGVYLSGWVFDPSQNLAALHLCDRHGELARLDTLWTRIPRPDVSEAFRNEPGFSPAPDVDAGFAVFAESTSERTETLHLKFSFVDGDRAFLPLRLDDPRDAPVIARLLASVDLHKPSGLPIIERHLAPLLARVQPITGPEAKVLLRGPLERPQAMVVALGSTVLPRAMLSECLHDPAGADEQIVLVCGPNWDQAGLNALQDLVRFYRLPASVLLVSETADPLVALREARRWTNASGLLLSEPGVCGVRPGWRAALRQAAAATPAVAFACPTVLYEDFSIRFAGTAAVRVHHAAPFARVEAALAGMPAGAAPVGETRAAAAGSLACCLVLPPGLAALDGAGAMTTDAGREAAFFLRLQACGRSGVWAPQVQVYAPEETWNDPGRVGRLVDGWMLRQLKEAA